MVGELCREQTTQPDIASHKTASALFAICCRKASQLWRDLWARENNTNFFIDATLTFSDLSALNIVGLGAE